LLRFEHGKALPLCGLYRARPSRDTGSAKSANSPVDPHKFRVVESPRAGSANGGAKTGKIALSSWRAKTRAVPDSLRFLA
jgi:hypothetical protein